MKTQNIIFFFFFFLGGGGGLGGQGRCLQSSEVFVKIQKKIGRGGWGSVGGGGGVRVRGISVDMNKDLKFL